MSMNRINLIQYVRATMPVCRMMLATALLSPLTLRAEQQMLRMEASLAPTEIFQGESTQLTLFVHGYDATLGEPDLSGLPADIQLLGQQDRHQQSIQIVNGVHQVTRLSGRMFTYRVTPHQAGTFTFNPVTLLDPDGAPLPATIPDLTVKPIPAQDFVHLWVNAPTNTIIVDEEFTVSTFVRIRKPTRPFQAHSPIPEGTAPQLHVPFLDLHPGEGLNSENITQLLQRLLVREGEAFRINDRVIGRDPFGGMFGREQEARFQLPRRTDPDNPDYYLYELTSRWSADREGDYKFGPVRFRGNIIANVNANGQATQTGIYAIGEPATVRVRTPPSQGRPPTFIGASGTAFSIETKLDTQVCQTGDPVTLTIEIKGDGPSNRIRAPRSQSLLPLEQDFRVQSEPMRTESMPGGRRFQYLIRPRHAGTLEIPALEIAYFDLASRTYQTVQSDPLPIRVNPGDELERENMTGLSTGGRMRIAITAAPGDLPPAPFDLQPAASYRFFVPALHIPLLLIGPLLFLLMRLKQWLPRHMPILQERARRKQAFQKAMQQLQQPAENQSPVKILREYLIATAGQTFAKGDAAAMRQQLLERGLAQTDIDTIIELLTQTAYTGQQQDAPPQQVQTLIQKVAQEQNDRKRNARKRMRSAGPASKALILLAMTGLTLSAVADQVSRFEERRTQNLLMQAREPADFLVLAKALSDRVDLGERNPTVLYNLGTALLLAEQPELALPILKWAERRGANSWNVRRNMLVARRLITQDPTLQLPWIRTLLFWHYRTSLTNRMTIAALLFAGLWILATMQSFAAHRKWLLLPTTAIWLLTSASIIASFYADHQSEQDWQLQRRQIQHIIELHEEENER